MNNPLAFRFAKLGCNPEFRQRRVDCGWTSGMTVYPAQPGETEEQVKARMEPGRHLLVMPDPDQPFEMSMQVIEVNE